ncbi:MAG: 4-alpha-glucanotransferase [Clostridia bacterium]|nr:4-alpha-glucanotransferase [Clostridia bacterium]
MARTSGVLMHISSLYGDYSIGSFGDNAKEFIDFLKECDFSYWQVLPFCMADSFNSPYQSYSAFAGNPYFVDLKILHKKGVITDEQLKNSYQNTPYSCEYARLYEERLPLLFEASKKCNYIEQVKKFVDENAEISAFCMFMAKKEANGQKPWQKWDNDEINPEILFMWQFIQYEFFVQWAEIKMYANKNGIKIIGDMPIYVSLDSADVWSNQKLFCLDNEGKPTKVAGVPPDYFCADGQLWGNPIYNWEEMKKDGYSWWGRRISAMAKMFDGIRIDHFRGIEAYWSVDGDETTAKNGRWEKGPGMELINVIKQNAGNCMIIAEDLGEITEEVNALVKQSGFPGMRVFQFGFIDGSDSTNMPHNYPKNCIAYTGTHDNNTLLGYLWELDSQRKKDMLSYCGFFGGNFEDGFDYVLRTLWRSHADTVILPVQDLLGYGSDTRLNTPGSAEGNWRFRITKEQLQSINKEKFRELNRLYKRKP